MSDVLLCFNMLICIVLCCFGSNDFFVDRVFFTPFSTWAAPCFLKSPFAGRKRDKGNAFETNVIIIGEY